MIKEVLESADLGLYGGFLVITGGGQKYRVPFMGLKGDYTKMNVLGSISFVSANLSEIFRHFRYCEYPHDLQLSLSVPQV